MASCSNDEEEEIIVYANFEEGIVDKEIFQQPDLKFKVIGLESENPIVQLGDTTFKGVWNDTIGTKVFLEEDDSPSEPFDPVFTVMPPKMLKYKCMSTKTLDLSRIFLKSKTVDKSEDSCDSIKLQNNQDELFEEKSGIFELINETINPDSNTSITMKNIINESSINMSDDSEPEDSFKS